MESNSGIYKIVNTINKKYYVGSSKNLSHRKRNHFWMLRNNRHPCNHLQNAYNLEGEDNFEFVTILNNIPDNQLLIEEQKLLNIAKNESERCYTKNYISGRIEMTLQVKEKMSNSKKELYKNGYINHRKGKHHTEKSKQLIRKSHLNKPLSKEHKINIGNGIRGEKNGNYNKRGILSLNFGRKQSLETIQKRIDKQNKPIKQIDLNGNFIKVWNSIKEAAQYVKSKNSDSLIVKVCKNKRKSAYGFKWEYI